jgi:hypothetical protein
MKFLAADLKKSYNAFKEKGKLKNPTGIDFLFSNEYALI